MAEAHGPAVTVAMVTYNAERFVHEAIASVLAQDFADLELLVCDDCSTDATWTLVRQFDDPRIRAIRNERNIGEYANRNQAIRLARGRYLMFLDGDDLLYAHGLGVMVRALESHPEAGFASAQPPSEKFIYPLALSPREFFRCQFLGPNVTAHDFTQLLFRLDALRAAGGFDERFRTGDTHIQFRIARERPCVLIADGLAWWRRYPGQASEGLHRELAGLAELTRYGQELLDDPACPLDDGERRIARANLCRMLLRNAYRLAKRGRVARALRLVRTAGVRARHWRHFFAREQRPHLRDVSGARPLRGSAS